MSKKTREQTRGAGKSKAILFTIIVGFIILVLPVFYLPKALDHALMPRLFILSLFLLLFLPFVFLKKKPAFDFSILRNKLFWILSGYFIITAISIFFAVNYKEAYFDIVKTFVFISLAASLVIVFSNTKDWYIQLPKFVVIAALIAFAVGFSQYFNKVLMGTSAFLPDGREVIYEVKGIMAHKNQYAISLMLMLPFLGFGIYQFKRGWKWASIISFVLLLLMIVLLKTRSAWVGIILSSVVAITLISLFPKKFGVSVKARNIIAITTLIAIISGATVIEIAGKKDIYSFFGKLRSIASPEAGNNSFRLKIWQITGKMIKDYPVTGVGAGNWKLHSAEYYNQMDINFQKGQMNWIRPHNDFLWVFAEKGIIGFLLFISIFGIAVIYIFKLIFSDVGRDQKVLTLFLLSGLICYVTVSMFSFPLERINQQAYLVLLLVSVVTLFHSSMENKKPIKNTRPILYPALLMLAISVVYSFAMIDLEYKVRTTRNAMVNSDWKTMLREGKNLPTTFRTLDSDATPLKSYEAQAYSKLGQTAKSSAAYIEALEAHPTKINMMNNLGKTYYELGEYKMAEDMFLNALEILPNYKESLINLSTTYYKTGKYEKTLETLERIPHRKRDETSNKNIKAVKQVLKKQREANQNTE